MAAKLRVCFVGNGRVGKTSLFDRFLHDTFDPKAESTIGVETGHKTLTIENIDYDVTLVDSAGQELYAQTSLIYIRGSHVVFLCFNPVADDCEAGLKIWYNAILNSKDVGKIFLVATQSDLWGTDQCSKLPRILRDEGELLRRYGATRLFQTSAMTGEGVLHALETAIQEVVAEPGWETGGARGVDIANRNTDNNGGCGC